MTIMIVVGVSMISLLATAVVIKAALYLKWQDARQDELMARVVEIHHMLRYLCSVKAAENTNMAITVLTPKSNGRGVQQ